MPVLRREDGVQFVLQPYRELLSMQSRGLLKQELHFLGQNYGMYARVFSQPDKRFEAVFSHDPGYLLGEMVWNHFGRPVNLIYCEALPDSEEILLIMVRDGNVFLDARVDALQLQEEITALYSNPILFKFYVVGNVPVSEHPEAGKLHLEKAVVQSFAILNTSVFLTIAIEPQFHLLPLERAVAELKLDQKAQLLALGVLLAVLGMGVWWWFSTESTPPGVVETPLETFQMALRTPAPSDQLSALSRNVPVIYNIPGWIATQLTYSGSAIQVQANTLGGSLLSLLAWTNFHHMGMQITPAGATLSIPILVQTRITDEEVPQSTQLALATLIDRVKQTLPEKSIQISNTVNHGFYKEVQVIITVDNVAPEVLNIIGQQLIGLPVTLTNCSFNLANGLLSGTIQLTILGD